MRPSVGNLNAVASALLATVPGLMAAQPNLQRLGLPFRIPRIEWRAPTNALPKEFPIYRVVPRSFPPSFVADLLTMAQLTETNRVQPLKALALEKGRCSYRSADGHRSLRVVPNCGWVWYRNQDVVPKRLSEVSDVPTEDEAIEQALTLLRRAGIDNSELEIDPATEQPRVKTSLEKWSTFDRTTQKHIEAISRRGAMFGRQEGGIGFFGPGTCGGALFWFGNNRQIIELEIVWRKLERAGVCPVPSPDAIMKMIKRGKAVIRADADEPFGRLVVLSATPQYLEYRGHEPQEFVYPYLLLEGEVKVGGTNSPVEVSCPMSE